MFRLLEIEWLKLRGYRPFWVLMVLFIVLLLLTNIVMRHGFSLTTQVGPTSFVPDYSFPRVWDYVGFWVCVLGGLLPVFIIISTTNEIQFRTNRQNVIDGWSRAEFYHAKWLSCVVVALGVTLVAALLGASFGFLTHRPVIDPATADPMMDLLTRQTDLHPEATGHLDRLLFIFVLALNYNAFAMTLSFFIKRGVLTVILFLSFCYPLEWLSGWIIKLATHSHIGAYFPLQCSANLLTLPTPDILKGTGGAVTSPTNLILTLTSAGWLLFYYLAGWWKLRRSDW